MAAIEESTHLLRLPREIRDEIYRGILPPTIGYGDFYDLDPAILRVNKQVHREASETFYTESCWILFKVNFPVYVPETPQGSSRAPAIFREIDDFSFGGHFAMEIDFTIHSTSHDYSKKRPSWIVASVHDLHCTLHYLIRHVGQDSFQLVISIHEIFKKHTLHHNRILHTLRGIRRAESASVQGNHFRLSDRELERRMVAQYMNQEERAGRVSTHQRDAGRQVALGKYSEAARIYRECLHSNWEYFRENDPEDKDHYIQDFTQLSDMAMKHALCILKLGYIAEALSLVNSFINMVDVHKTPIPEALYLQGLIFLAKDSSLDAKHCFHRALELRPEYEEVVQELDKMGEKLPIRQEEDDAS